MSQYLIQGGDYKTIHIFFCQTTENFVHVPICILKYIKTVRATYPLGTAVLSSSSKLSTEGRTLDSWLDFVTIAAVGEPFTRLTSRWKIKKYVRYSIPLDNFEAHGNIAEDQMP